MKYLLWSVVWAALAALPLAGFQQGGPYKIGDGVSAPVLLSKVEPRYTEEARDQKIQGTLVLAMVVGADGYARDVRVVRSVDQGLDANGIQAVLEWKFKPGEKDGQPVAVFATVEINFKLN